MTTPDIITIEELPHIWSYIGTSQKVIAQALYPNVLREVQARFKQPIKKLPFFKKNVVHAELVLDTIKPFFTLDAISKRMKKVEEVLSELIPISEQNFYSKIYRTLLFQRNADSNPERGIRSAARLIEGVFIQTDTVIDELKGNTAFVNLGNNVVSAAIAKASMAPLPVNSLTYAFSRGDSQVVDSLASPWNPYYHRLPAIFEVVLLHQVAHDMIRDFRPLNNALFQSFAEALGNTSVLLTSERYVALGTTI